MCMRNLEVMDFGPGIFCWFVDLFVQCAECGIVGAAGKICGNDPCQVRVQPL